MSTRSQRGHEDLFAIGKECLARSGVDGGPGRRPSGAVRPVTRSASTCTGLPPGARRVVVDAGPAPDLRRLFVMPVSSRKTKACRIPGRRGGVATRTTSGDRGGGRTGFFDGCTSRAADRAPSIVARSTGRRAERDRTILGPPRSWGCAAISAARVCSRAAPRRIRRRPCRLDARILRLRPVSIAGAASAAAPTCPTRYFTATNRFGLHPGITVEQGSSEIHRGLHRNPPALVYAEVPRRAKGRLHRAGCFHSTLGSGYPR